MSLDAWPELPLSEWEPTYLTLHRWTQVLGKVRLARATPVNHWWHITLYVTSRGLTTSSMPASGGGLLTLTLDLREHRFVAHTSSRGAVSFELSSMPVADFYGRVMAVLERLGEPTSIWPVPVEVTDRTAFPDDRHHAHYDPQAVERLHRILMSTSRVFEQYRGQFVGKSSPVHFFWGAFDLAVTRFNGRRNPKPPEDAVNAEAYSHEVVSHGFWPGGDWPFGPRVELPVFYAYAVPEPEGFRTASVRPDTAFYSQELSEYLLPYDDVRLAEDPAATLLDFMNTTYAAAARNAVWDFGALVGPSAPAAAAR